MNQTIHPGTIYGQSILKKGVSPRDRIGNELAVGDIIVYVLHHHAITGTAIYVGKITKITPKGYIWATNIPLVPMESVAEKKINKNYEILKLSDDIMDQLMLRRLSIDAVI